MGPYDMTAYLITMGISALCVTVFFYFLLRKKLIVIKNQVFIRRLIALVLNNSIKDCNHHFVFCRKHFLFRRLL